MGIDEEINVRWEEAKRELQECDRPTSDLHVINYLMNNFYCKVPGGDYWREYDLDSKELILMNLDQTHDEYVRNIFSPENAENRLQPHSPKFNQTTFRKLRGDITEALVNAGISWELLAELTYNETVNGTDAIIEREFKTVIPILFEAYKYLRRQGYCESDLV